VDDNPVKHVHPAREVTRQRDPRDGVVEDRVMRVLRQWFYVVILLVVVDFRVRRVVREAVVLEGFGKPVEEVELLVSVLEEGVTAHVVGVGRAPAGERGERISGRGREREGWFPRVSPEQVILLLIDIVLATNSSSNRGDVEGFGDATERREFV
jgi:hypothetical protein